MTETSLGWHQVGCSRCVDQRWRTTCHQNEVCVRGTWSFPLSADLIAGRRSTLGWQNSTRYSGTRPLMHFVHHQSNECATYLQWRGISNPSTPRDGLLIVRNLLLPSLHATSKFVDLTSHNNQCCRIIASDSLATYGRSYRNMFWIDWFEFW